MNWLERLKSEKSPDTYPAKPAKPSNAGFAGSIPGPFVKTEGETEGSAGFAGSVSGHIENSMLAAVVVLPAPDWASGHASGVMNTLSGRLTVFKAKGLSAGEAEALADRLLIRDQAGDDMRVCLECSNLSGWSGRRQCRGGLAAGMGQALVSAGQVATLQRCDSFKASS